MLYHHSGRFNCSYADVALSLEQEPLFQSTDLPTASMSQLVPRAAFLGLLFTPLCVLGVPVRTKKSTSQHLLLA